MSLPIVYLPSRGDFQTLLQMHDGNKKPNVLCHKFLGTKNRNKKLAESKYSGKILKNNFREIKIPGKDL